MEEFVYLSILFDIYGNLLTEKQQVYFKCYYEDNLTMQEIADDYNVSKNAISKQIDIIKEKLLDYESKLKIKEKKDKIISKIDDQKIINLIEDTL